MLILEEDRVAVLGAPPQPELDALMVDLGVLGYDEYAEAQARSDRFNTSPTRVIRSQQIATEDDLAAAERRYLEEMILEEDNLLFIMKDGKSYKNLLVAPTHESFRGGVRPSGFSWSM